MKSRELDFAAFLLRYLPGALSLAAALGGYRSWTEDRPDLPLGLMALPALVVFLSAFFGILALLSAVLPSVRPGCWTRKEGPPRSWVLRRALEESHRVFGLGPLVRCSYLLRSFHVLCLGGFLSPRANLAMDARIEDLSVLEVGAGCTLAAQTLISSHDEDPDNWRFVQTRIGQGVFVGMYSQLGVGTHAEDGVWIGMRNRLKGTHLPAGTRIPDFGVSP